VTREWKPGDVALVTIPGHEERLMTRYSTGVERGWYYGVGLNVDGKAHFSDEGSGRGHVARPLVVIDPEDRQQVERLQVVMWQAHGTHEVMRDQLPHVADVLQSALREFADPKPDEPTGLGAVVESEDGRRWVRSKDITTVCHWKPSAGGRRVRWSDLPHVRVLSEGVAE
jgi:hypothetical protein